MTIRRIRLLGDPILRARCERIANPGSPAARVVLDDLRDTLRDFRARTGFGRGIAAPQIGAPIRLVYAELEGQEPLVLINPEVLDIGYEDFAVWDDCFSLPNLMVRVLRAWHIRLKWQDTRGEWHERIFEGEAAELLQHELDHLDGVLIVDRPHGLDPFCLREEWEQRHAAEGRVGPPEIRAHTDGFLVPLEA